MGDANLQDSDSLCPFGLTFSADIKWKNYIQSIVWPAARKVGSLGHARPFFARISYIFIRLLFVLSLNAATIFILMLLLCI